MSVHETVDFLSQAPLNMKRHVFLPEFDPFDLMTFFKSTRASLLHYLTQISGQSTSADSC